MKEIIGLAFFSDRKDHKKIYILVNGKQPKLVPPSLGLQADLKGNRKNKNRCIYTLEWNASHGWK